jgi:site-specific DNA-cytosine methylase
MDTTKPVTHVSLCAGYGGIDLGLKRAIPNLRTIAFSEIEGFACANLVAKMEAGCLDAAPIWTDVKTFPWEEFRGKVDILSGGYPCQPFSAAGKRLGKDDPRHLWPWIADGIRVCRPAVCFFENVEGHISLGLREVIGELEEIGYRATWGLFSAAEVGAPHQRKRVFILAHKQHQRSQGWLQRGTDSQRKGVDGHAGCCGASGRVWPSRPGQLQHEWEPPRVVANTSGIDEQRGSAWAGRGQRGQSDAEEVQRARDGYGQTEPSLGGNADGPAGGMDYAELCVSCDNRTDELRLLGNGVVPATAERAFRILSARFIQ